MTSQIVMMVLTSNTNSVSLDELAPLANKIVEVLYLSLSLLLIPQSINHFVHIKDTH